MVYPAHFEIKIGFDTIRTLLNKHCISSLGEEKVSEMAFSYSIKTISTQLKQTNELLTLLNEYDSFPTDAYFDIRPYLFRIKVEGTYLQETELFELYRSLITIHHIVQFIQQKDAKRFEELHLLAKDVLLFPEICKQIDAILTKFGRIKDNASPELASIRRSKLQLSSTISRLLQTIIRKGQTDGYIDKEVTPSVREGRLVIPVSPAYKRKINGIIHDESASGKTIFIEPAEVVETNNQIRELELQEKREITRILIQCANFIRPMIPELANSYHFLGTIDFIRAKALLAKQLQAIKPIVEDMPCIDWKDTFHPLLYISLQKQGKSIVPLSITLNQQERILVISGPNAGGKSVCLKTVGLIQYMMQCGMLVPMKENSTMGIFSHIFIDIGDEQSIENDLSTYSSHLTSMKFFAKHCNETSLLLIDEFGTGTEPLIGGAIAEASLRVFNQQKAFGVITTHYTNLKHFASENDGIVNGAMLYDRHLMQPLFQLEIGNPGSSFAIEIARKIGLPESIIADATAKVGVDHIDYDKNLQDIARDKRYWENKRQQIRLKEKKMEETMEQLRAELESISKQRKQILKEAKNEAEILLKGANASIENTIRTIKQAQAEKESTLLARKEVEIVKKKLKEDDANHVIDKRLHTLKTNKIKQEHTASNEPKSFAIGDAVCIKGKEASGIIVEMNQKSAIIAIGQLKSTIKWEQLERISHKQAKKQRQVSYISKQTEGELKERRLQFKQEIDVRGKRAEEALQIISYYIDDAFIVNVSKVRILHGTGTGVLRDVIRKYLATIPGVKKISDEHIQLGGAGITVVEFD
jgi:DNA mismatch repair protein MutS2